MSMQFVSTGAAARLLGSTEPRLAELVRRGKIQPEPQVIAGRRQWARQHILQAAEYLGRDVAQVLANIEQEVTRVP